jgi:DnaK suppressor protein
MAAKKKAAKTKAKAKSAVKKADSKSKAGAAKKAAAKKAPAKKAAPKSKPSATRKTASTTAAKTAPTAKTRKAAPSTTGPAQDIAPYESGHDEEYMNEAQVEHFRNILLAWKRELMEEVDRTVHHMQDEAASFPDPNDRATQESEFSMELRARDRERKLIKKIDEALMNLENDEYGYCEACGVEIGIRRLEARPTATLCIDCKTLDEIREKQMG